MTPSVSRGAGNACNHWINGGVDDCKCDTEGVTDTSCCCSWCLQSVADCGNCDTSKHLMNIPWVPASFRLILRVLFGNNSVGLQTDLRV